MNSETARSILRTKNLSRLAGVKCVVDNISIVVHRGQIVAIVGPSGAGKSSFLRLLNRLDEPSSGTFYLDGQDYRRIPPRELRRRLGMVMQQAYLFPGTVADNIRYGPEQRGENVPNEVIGDLLEQVDLPDFAGRDASRLSGGEAQRVSLARTLANSPQILLLDEPTSALDDDARDSVETLICKIIREQDLTCLMVTHDLQQARRMASHAMLMENGQLGEIGPIARVLDVESIV